MPRRSREPTVGDLINTLLLIPGGWAVAIGLLCGGLSCRLGQVASGLSWFGLCLLVAIVMHVIARINGWTFRDLEQSQRHLKKSRRKRK